MTNMIAKIMTGAASGPEASEKERDNSSRMDNGGLETPQHADTTPERGPDKHQQLQQQPKPKLRLQPKLQPKPQQEPKPRSAPTPARRWETVLPRAQS